MDNLKEIVIKANRDDSLFDVIREEYYRDRKGDRLLSSVLAELHNEEILDLVKLFSGLENSQGKHDFFSLQHVFEEVLPKIEAPVKEVANCVKNLTIEAGTNMLMRAFREFCEKNTERPKQLLDMALTDVDEEFDHLSTAIESGVYINEAFYISKALELVNHENKIVAQRAVFALGRVNYVDQGLLENAILKIKDASKSNNSDVFIATSMRALFSIIFQLPSLEAHFVEFLDEQEGNFGEHYVHSASEILFYEKHKVTENIESRLLGICCYTKPEKKVTIDNIDYALEQLLKQKKFKTCVTFLERFFTLSDYKLSIEYFDSFVRELHQHRDTYLSSLVTRWLLSKSIKLGNFCTELLKDSDKGIYLSFDKSYLTDKEQGIYLFLARKACGWFFIQPKTAMSLIESLIDDAPDEELQDIQQLIFNPLLISYPGSIHEHLEELENSKNSRHSGVAKVVLSQFSKYQESLKTASHISELRPSEQERHTYWKHHNKLMNESMIQARSESFLSSLFFGNESVLLYGNKSIHYIHHGDEKTRQEIPLQELSHSFEFASMHNLDPHSLDNMLWQFKAEGCQS